MVVGYASQLYQIKTTTDIILFMQDLSWCRVTADVDVDVKMNNLKDKKEMFLSRTIKALNVIIILYASLLAVMGLCGSLSSIFGGVG
jgi:hypothetical protein